MLCVALKPGFDGQWARAPHHRIRAPHPVDPKAAPIERPEVFDMPDGSSGSWFVAADDAGRPTAQHDDVHALQAFRDAFKEWFDAVEAAERELLRQAAAAARAAAAAAGAAAGAAAATAAALARQKPPAARR